MPVRMAGPSPLLGYNTNVRHKGKLYHIQTEDSGVQHPHIITHLFADGGRVVASKKTGYADILEVGDLQDRVKQMMRDQHKAMFIGLRDGEFDEPEPEEHANAGKLLKAPTLTPPPLEVDALEAAAARLAANSPAPAPAAPAAPAQSAGRYQPTRPARAAAEPPPPTKSPDSIFGENLLSEKSLDEVILSYLAEDLDEDGA